MEQLNSMIDKTIPIEPDKEVIIDLFDISKYINEEKVYGQLDELANYINNLTNNVFAFNSSYLFFVSSYLEKDTLNRIVYPSMENIDYFIYYSLNYSNKLSVDDYDTYSKRIKELSEIKNKKELEEKFPYVYKNYYFYKSNYIYLKRNYIFDRNYEKFLLSLHNDLQSKCMLEYFKSNKNMDFISYIKDYSAGLKLLLDSSDLIYDAFMQKKLNIELEYKKEKDKDIVELVVANAYMKNFKKASDVNQKQIYLYYLSNYFERYASKINTLKYYNSNTDKIIKLKDLYDDYIQELKQNPNLRIIDFKKEDFSNMTIEESKDFMNEYLKDLHANWKFFDGTNLNTDDDFIEELREKIEGITDPDKKANALENLKLFIEKKKYFDSSDPFYRIQGINSFDGYIGYIYTNGMVVLDKFFENTKTKRIAKNQAIYVMNIMDLYSISINSKNTIITDSLCERYIHKGDWKSKVDEKRKKDTRIYTAKELENMIAIGLAKR